MGSRGGGLGEGGVGRGLVDCCQSEMNNNLPCLLLK